jgi:hypothetical protein
VRKVVVVIAAAMALALPALASAKGGPDRATITGPGLDRPVVLRGFGETGRGTLGRLTMEGGYFPEVFGDQPDPRLRKKPARLGPRYRVAYRVPGPRAAVTLHQDLYPYAAGRVVTFMPAGQHLWGGQRTKGGWMRAPELAPGQQTLRAALVHAGLPAAAPTPRTLESSPLRWGAVAAGAVALAMAAFVALRRYRNLRSGLQLGQ